MTRPSFYSEELAKYVYNVEYTSFPEEVIDKAKLCLMDNIGCALGGLDTTVGNVLTRFLEDEYSKQQMGKGESTILGTTNQTSVWQAAFINSELANVLDFDDTYSGHPGAVIVQSALGVAESLHLSGKELLTAIISGYEVATRIGRSIVRPKIRKTAGHVWMPFGSAAVAGKLFKLNETAMANAFGVAGAAAPVPSDMKCSLNPMDKELGMGMVKNNYGFCSEIGIKAALLANLGYTGPIDILNGDTGFWQMAGGADCICELITHDLGKEYEILNVGFKPYSCSRHFHAAIDGVLELMRKNNLGSGDLKEIRVKSFTALSLPPKSDYKPKTLGSMIYSVPYTVAAAALGLTPGPEWFKAVNVPKVFQMAKKVKLIGDAEIDKSMAGRFYAEVEVDSIKGSDKVKIDCPKGERANPLTREEMTNKFISLAAPIQRKTEKAKETVKMITSIENVKDIRKLTQLLHQ